MAEEKKMNIYEAISKCMEDIGAVGKNDRNKTQGFMYRGIDAVMNAINPALVKNHVFVVPEVLEQQRTERQTNKGGILFYSICKIRFTFFAEDGSHIEAITVGEGMQIDINHVADGSDKYGLFRSPNRDVQENNDGSYEITECMVLIQQNRCIEFMVALLLRYLR